MLPDYKMILKKSSDLIPYTNNSRTHSDSQVAQIAASIREFGFTNPLLIDEQDNIIAGHGRLMAADKLGIEQVPCIVLAGLSKAQKKAYVIADNKLALNAGWDDELLRLEFDELSEMGFDLELTGFSLDEIGALEFDDQGTDEDEYTGENIYTDKIETPIYQPTGEAPDLSELIQTNKSDSLISEIYKTDLPLNVKDFLVRSAYRHDEYDFRAIANYYATCEDEKLKELIEKSALVIIDYEKAIEYGFVKMTKDLAELSKHG